MSYIDFIAHLPLFMEKFDGFFPRIPSVSVVSMTQQFDENNIRATTKRSTSIRCSIESPSRICEVGEDGEIIYTKNYLIA